MRLAEALGRTLYLSRNLANGERLRKWALEQGFGSVIVASDLHVTIAYSSRPLRWPKLIDGPLAALGGNREVKTLGDEGAVVLKFWSPALRSRWKEILELGASWDYPDYQAHVTFTYAGKGVDLSRVKPYDGPLVFGGEVAKEIKKNWKAEEN